MSYLTTEIEQAWQDTLDYYGPLYGLIFAPTVSTFSPADGANSIAVDTNVVVTFSEAITNGTGIIEVRAGSATGTVFETFDAATSNRLTFSGRTLTIDPVNSLADGTNYFVTLASGSVKDMAGNSYTGTSVYDFQTSINATYSLQQWPTDTSANEGQNVDFKVTTTGIQAGTTLSYTITGVSASDISNGSLTGTATVDSDGIANIVIPIFADQFTEGAEILTVSLQGESSSIRINDTSTDTTAPNTGDYTAQIEAIYLAYYGRPADVAGLAYWNTALNTANGDLASIINSFGTTAEADALYSSSSNIAKINAIYFALFNRSADAGGLIYYAGLLDTGAKSQASIALDILNGATGDDETLITKKLAVSADFTAAMQSDVMAMIAYDGTTAATTARSMLSAVTLTSDDSGVVENILYPVETTGGYLVEWDRGISISSVADETFIGDSDVNIVVFRDFLTNYTLTETNTGWLISSATDGNDMISNVERLQFADLSLALDTDGNAGQAYRLYKAAFDRVPDLGGLGYWISKRDSGMDLIEVSARFVDSTEFKTMYGASSSNGDFITAVYNNVLDRTPDAEGYAWWVDQLNTNPDKTRQEVLAEFSESDENVAAVASLIGSGIIYYPYVV